MARPKRRSRRACLSFNNLQKFFFRGNRGLFRLRDRKQKKPLNQRLIFFPASFISYRFDIILI